ncbi:hypothetical protein [Macrococcoides canis]|uniref:hypothetical protein n=1 Tax=Macrococcoides canis TaxID=1855823 RepID=UPI001061A101|nr:hypothetical protein [Macrococcus canis]TDM23103.1 hypothetical protein ETI02_08200 [Macrococcus canis]
MNEITSNLTSHTLWKIIDKQQLDSTEKYNLFYSTLKTHEYIKSMQQLSSTFQNNPQFFTLREIIKILEIYIENQLINLED